MWTVVCTKTTQLFEPNLVFLGADVKKKQNLIIAWVEEYEVTDKEIFKAVC